MPSRRLTPFAAAVVLHARFAPVVVNRTRKHVKLPIIGLFRHGHHLGDSLGKLRGLAAFAAEYGQSFHRIEAVTRIDDGTIRVLDMTEEPVRKAVADAADATALYASSVASQYTA